MATRVIVGRKEYFLAMELCCNMGAQALFGRWCEEEPPLHTTEFELYWTSRLLEAEILYEEFKLSYMPPLRLPGAVAAS